MEREAWALYDARTGKRLAMSSYLTAEQAAWEVDNLRKRDAEGKLRPEVHELMPHIGFVKLTDETWGSKPGDVIIRVCTCGETKGLHYPDCPMYPDWMKSEHGRGTT